MNVFPDVDLMARRQPLIDDDIQCDVEPLVASLEPEAVDASPPGLGSMVEAIWVSTMSFIALGSWNFVEQAGAQRWPVGLAASMCNVYWVPTSRRRVPHSTTQQHWKPAAPAGTDVLAQKSPSTLSMYSTTSARFAKKAPAGRMSRKVPRVAANFEGSGAERLGGSTGGLLYV
jgi:hypothetical protein